MEEVRDFASAGIAVKPLQNFKVDVCSNFPPRPDQNFPQQVAIASRLQAISAWSEFWKTDGKIVPPRGFAFAAYDIAPKQLLLVYALHLKSNRGSLRENIVMREESIRQLSAHMHAMNDAYGMLGNLAWIVGGDFNTSPDNPKLAAEKTMPGLRGEGFSWGLGKCSVRKTLHASTRQTLPARVRRSHFLSWAQLKNAAVLNTSAQSSDHRAIEATFEFAACVKIGGVLCLTSGDNQLIPPPRILHAPARGSRSRPRSRPLSIAGRNICTEKHCARASNDRLMIFIQQVNHDVAALDRPIAQC